MFFAGRTADLPVRDPSQREAVVRGDFRHDIEGLRALAILLVAGYHIWSDRVSGGVDVFLMISGFFVVGALLRRHGTGEKLIVSLYLSRLAGRLVPTSAIALAAIVAGSALLFPVTRWADIASGTLASFGYLENWWLVLAGSTYGAADESADPLQHFWSLSVQGQLFVAIPLILIAVGPLLRRLEPTRASRLVVAGLVVATLTSFGYAAWLTQVDQSLAYYSTLTRAWEYLAGALLAVVMPKLRVPVAARVLLGWVGVAMILCTGVLIDGRDLFPGPAALLPLGGAALMMIGGSGGRTSLGVDRLLAWRPFSEGGRYAYGMYVWHWPLLVFAIALTDSEVGIVVGSAVLIVSAVLAVATRRLTSRETRRGRRSNRSSFRYRSVLSVCLAATLALPMGFLLYRTAKISEVETGLLAEDLTVYPGALAVRADGAWGVPQNATPIPDLLAAQTDWPDAVEDGCVTGDGETRLRLCSYGDVTSGRSILLVGGSHSEHWLPPLELSASERGFQLDVLLKVGCPFTAHHDKEECQDWQDKVLRHIKNSSYDFVFTTATRPAGGGAELVPEGYTEIWAELEGEGQQILAIRDTPWFEEAPLDCLASGAPAEQCSVPLADVLMDRSPTEDIQATNVQFLDLTEHICPENACPAVLGNRVVYRDTNHLTTTFAVTLAPALDEELGPLLSWW